MEFWVERVFAGQKDVDRMLERIYQVLTIFKGDNIGNTV